MGDVIDLTELVMLSVEKVKAKLPELGDGDLPTLAVLEGQGQNRATLLAAIDQEKDKRDVAALEAEAAKPIYTQAQLDEKLAEQASSMFTQEALDEQLAAVRGEALAGGKEPGTTQAAIADAKANGAVALAALTGPTKLVFVDDAGDAIKGLPAMDFEPHDFHPNGSQILLMKPVEFPVAMPESQIAGAVLFGDGDEPVGKAMLVQPFGIGGGRQATLAPRTLSFA